MQKNLSILNYLELFGSFRETNSWMYIPTHQTVKLTPQHVFQLQSDHLQKKDELDMPAPSNWAMGFENRNMLIWFHSVGGNKNGE